MSKKKNEGIVWIDRILRWMLFLLVIAVMVGGFVLLKMHMSQQIAAVPPGGGKVEFSPSGIQERFIGFYLRFRQKDLQTPASKEEKVVVFEVYPGETASSIAERLQEEGLIKDAGLFKLYAKYYGIGTRLEAGKFRLSPSMTIPEIAMKLQKASGKDIFVTIPEGWRVEEIAQMLTEKGIMNGDQFLAIVKKGEAGPSLGGPYDFLSDKPAGASLEGYLFPDTYRIPENARPEDLVARMLHNFGVKVTPKMRQDAKARGLTLFQVVTLASIVERETPLASERPLIASVYLNRLFNPVCQKETRGYLDADPTVQYAMGYQRDKGTWWKQPLTLEEYKNVISPYNTYLHPGLPPGPICNPGLSAIKAVIYPQPSDYCFFVATGSGGHVFSKTAAEHQKQVERYQK